MDPVLRAAPAGRGIFVTSEVARGVFPYWGPYAVAKAGLEMLVKVYSANLIDPGIVRTRLRAPRLSRRRPEPAATAGKRGRHFPRPRFAGMHPQCEVVMAAAVSLQPNK